MTAGRQQGIARRFGAALAAAALAAGCAAGEGSAQDTPAGAQRHIQPADVRPDAFRQTADGAGSLPPPAQPVEPSQTHELTATASDAQSTFALDVDTGSYNLARAALRSGTLPDPSQVRIEEFVNAIDQGYPPPAGGDAFAVFADATSWPYAESPDRRLVRVGLSTADAAGERRPASLTFVVDTSGSMGDAGRLDLVRDALHLLVENLRPDDTVALVTYSAGAEVALPPTPASQAALIGDAIDKLRPGGSTNLGAGLKLGYSLGREALRQDGINRVVLLSDGIANTGLTDSGSILETIRTDAEQGIEMVTVGVGLGEYNDALMERLANDGDGFYAYIDTLEEAAQLFGTDLTSTLQTVARQARVRVVFEPSVVEGYRLLGFENRALPDAEFRNDERDAGEVGAGHQVTALYEVALTGAPGRLATVRLRWQDPADGEVREMARSLDAAAVNGAFTAADPVLQLDGVVAMWARAMRGEHTVSDPQVLAHEAVRVAELVGTPQAAEVAELMQNWVDLAGSRIGSTDQVEQLLPAPRRTDAAGDETEGSIKGSITGVMVATAIAGVVLLLWLIVTYNRLVRSRNTYQRAFSQIEAQLTRRHDLIPNLVETARRYIAQERDALEAVVAARAGAVDARSAASASVGEPAAMRLSAGAENALTNTVGQLFAVSEGYPELRASAHMTRLSEELTSAEDRIALARQQYNDAVLDYNNRRESVPATLFAGMLGFRPGAFFETDSPQKRQVHRVSFEARASAALVDQRRSGSR